jgi:multicomponent Na+:H+ antiporter subunit G
MILEIVVIALVCLGLVFFLGGTVGILRFPDFYSRLHPAGKMDTLASILIFLGLAIWTARVVNPGNLLTAVKILLISVFVFLASPTATHAIVDAGFRAGLVPWKKQGR